MFTAFLSHFISKISVLGTPTLFECEIKVVARFHFQTAVSPSVSEQNVVSPSLSVQTAVSPSVSEQNVVSPSVSVQNVVSPSVSVQNVVSPFLVHSVTHN